MSITLCNIVFQRNIVSSPFFIRMNRLTELISLTLNMTRSWRCFKVNTRNLFGFVSRDAVKSLTWTCLVVPMVKVQRFLAFPNLTQAFTQLRAIWQIDLHICETGNLDNIPSSPRKIRKQVSLILKNELIICTKDSIFNCEERILRLPLAHERGQKGVTMWTKDLLRTLPGRDTLGKVGTPGRRDPGLGNYPLGSKPQGWGPPDLSP